jgi:long-chain-fatty-acid---luciferin-component ligase
MTQNYVQLIDEALKDNSMLHLSLDELKARQDVLLERFFNHHYTNCEKYRRFCEGRSVNSNMIKGLDDISKIPLLDSFKTLRKTQFRSVKRKNIVAQFSSTGSSGKPLLWISLDQKTMDWMVQGMVYLLQTHIKMKPGATLMMLPDAPQLKFAATCKKVMSQIDNEYFFGLRAIFGDDPRPTIEPNTEGIDKFMKHPAKTKNLIGFPFTITQLYDYLEAKDMKLSLGKEGVIVTGGGWKPRQKDSKWANITRAEMEKHISNAFDVPVENIRDVYGCTEILLGYMECSHKRYHVPPWCYHVAVNPDDLSILKNGERGLGVCYDFAAHSWPAFVLTEDFIKVSDEQCPCGISGQTIEYLGRIQDEDPRGCAFKFEDKLFSEEYLSKDSMKPNPQSTDGLLQFLMKNKVAVSGKFVNENIDIFKKAIAMINEITSFTSEELTFVEEIEIFKFITLGKMLCYKEGTPTILSEQDIMEHMGLPLEAVKSILKLFEKRDFIKIIEKDDKKLYQYTKKADEFGEAFYPLLVWAIKWLK